MTTRIGIIGGSGLEELFKSGRHEATTSDGLKFQYFLDNQCGVDVVFVPRHGNPFQNTPLDVPYLDIFKLFSQRCVQAIISFSATGTLDEKIKLANQKSFVVPNDYIRGFGFRPISARLKHHPHADVTQPFDERLRRLIVSSGSELNYQMTDGGIYVLCEGNQFETKAEIAFINAVLTLGGYFSFPGCEHLNRDGAQVGMTAVKEAILAAEYKIPYALIACPVNLAAGMGDKRLFHEEGTLKVMQESAPYIKQLALKILDTLKKIKL